MEEMEDWKQGLQKLSADQLYEARKFIEDKIHELEKKEEESKNGSRQSNTSGSELPGPERRQFARHQVEILCNVFILKEALCSGNWDAHPVAVCNLSRSGMRFTSEMQPRVGEMLIITFQVKSQISRNLYAEVIRVMPIEKDGSTLFDVGVQFVDYAKVADYQKRLVAQA